MTSDEKIRKYLQILVKSKQELDALEQGEDE